MKRVLFVINLNLDNAGVPNVLMQIVRKLKDFYEFDVIVGSSAKGYYDDEFLSYGGKIFRHDYIGLLQIGYYSKLKNQLFSLKVLQEILNRGYKAKLCYIGYDNGSGYVNKVINEVNTKNLIEHVQLLPSDFNKNEALETTYFLLLPSESEGLPLVALEAQSSRTYCIASNNVPKDVDVGLFNRFAIIGEKAPSVWAEFIIQNKDYMVNLNMEKLQSINSDEYMKKISTVYNTPEKLGGYSLLYWRALIFNAINRVVWFYKGVYYAI